MHIAKSRSFCSSNWLTDKGVEERQEDESEEDEAGEGLRVVECEEEGDGGDGGKNAGSSLSHIIRVTVLVKEKTRRGEDEGDTKGSHA